MPRMRLTDKHPVHRKLENLFKIMDDEGISLFCEDGKISVKCDDVFYNLEDIDPHHDIYGIPPRMEWKLVKGEDLE